MDALELVVDPRWGVGLLFAMIRVAAFVVSSPVTGTAWPASGRLAAVVALSLFLARPVEGTAEIGPLLVGAVTNAAVGIAMGFLSGLLIHMFMVAGSLIDITGGLAVAQYFDPSLGTNAAVFGQFFHRAGVAFFVVLGGLEVLVRGLAGSVRLIPLDGAIDLSGALARSATELTGELMFAGVQLALPVVATLFLAEIVLGIANRFAPQANVMLLGLPLKLFITLVLAATVFAAMPGTVDAMIARMADLIDDIVRSLVP